MATEAPIPRAETPSVLIPSPSNMETECSGEISDTVSSREPGSGVRSDLPTAAPTLNPVSKTTFKVTSKALVPRSGASRVPVSSPVKPYSLPGSRRQPLQSQAGKGKSLPGAPPGRGRK